MILAAEYISVGEDPHWDKRSAGWTRTKMPHRDPPMRHYVSDMQLLYLFRLDPGSDGSLRLLRHRDPHHIGA